MTCAEAISKIANLKAVKAAGSFQDDYVEACNLAIEALKKQIPRKPLNKTSEYDGDYGKCPCCGQTVSDYDDLRVCTGCGQALDWR